MTVSSIIASQVAIVVRAEIAVQTLAAEQARGIVDDAVANVRGNPLVFLQHDVLGLEQALAARTAVENTPAAP